MLLLFRNPSTIVNDHVTVPIFDQYHIILATIKLTTSINIPDRVSIILLNQKHVYNGIVFKLFELYGIENPPSKNVQQRKKSLSKILTTLTNENEPFIKP